MKFSANVDALYMGGDVYKGIEDVAKAGIRDIEFWGWWDKDLSRLQELRERYALRYVGCCAKMVCMVDPANKSAYLEGMEESIETARKIGCTGLFTKPLDKSDAPFEEQYAVMTDMLRDAVRLLEGTGITLLLEPVSRLEAPETFLDNSTLGFQIVREIDHPNLRLLYDLYHMQLDEGDIVRRVTGNLPLIGHIHAAGIANRHELPDGEINYRYDFEAIEKAGYDKLVGLEYFPVKDVPAELKRVVFEHRYL